MEEEGQVEVRLLNETLDFPDDPVLDRILIDRGGVVRVEAGVLEVVPDD